MNNVLKGEQSIFYTWNASLGLNFWALSAYYLNGIFTPLVGFFDNQSMPDALYFLTLVKFGVMGGAFYVFSSQTFKISKWFHISFSTAYALMAYTTAYSMVIMWLDAFVYLPLIFLGIHRLMDQKKPAVLFFSYLLLFLSNFYMAFMIGVFSFLYFWMRLFINGKPYKQTIIRYFVTSFLAGGASMVTVLPAILDLRDNGESLTAIGGFFKTEMGAWDLISKSMVGMYDTSKYGSAPFIYIGLLPLVLCLFYFVSRKIPLKNKLLYGSLLLILIASVYIEPLNLFWHGMHAPNMFLFRFSFLISFFVIVLAGYGLEVMDQKEAERTVNLILGLLFLFLAVYLFSNRKRYDYLSAVFFIATLIFLMVYLVVFQVYRKKGSWQWLALLTAVLMFGETAMNAYSMIGGIKSDWGYPSRSMYSRTYEQRKKLVDLTKKENDTLYRLENLDPVSRNDSFNLGYSGVTMFSSIRNRHSSAYLNKLGFRSLGSNLNINYSNNTLVMDALLGIKYNLTAQDFRKYGFELKGKTGEYKLYENKNALPLGMLTDEKIYEKDAVDNQTELIQHLASMDEPLFSLGEITQSGMENLVKEQDGDELVYTKEDPTKEQSITWTVDIPAHTQAYFSLTATDFQKMGKSEVLLTVDGQTRKSGVTDTGQYYDLGYYEKAQKVEVQTVFIADDTSKIRIYQPDALFLDTNRFEEALTAIRKNGVDFQTSGRKAIGDVDLAEDQVLLTTIPYDKGWTAYIDGKKQEIPTFKNAFLTLKVPKGKHTIQFVFLPQGFKVGLSLFIGCLLLFFVYWMWLARSGKFEKKREEEIRSEEND